MLRKLVAATIAFGLLAGPSQAFNANPFIIQVGYAPGAAFDIIARTVGNHIGQYLPGNPAVVVENVEGAGSRRLLNSYLATGPHDASTIVMLSTSFTFDPILDPANTTFDPRDFNYLVSFSNAPTYCIATVASGITTFDQLISTPVNVGSSGRDATYLAAAAVNRAFGAKFNIITGFSGQAEVGLAMARGELQASCGNTYSALEANRAIYDFKVIAELSSRPFNLVPGAEFILDRVTDPTTRAALDVVFSLNLIRFSLWVHPDTSDEDVAILREAFARLSTDEAFLAEIRSRGIDVSITDGATVQGIVDQILATDPAVKDAMRALLQ